jgi:hypothetical protein
MKDTTMCSQPYSRTNRLTDGQMDRWTYGQMDRWTDRQTTNKAVRKF